MRLIEVTYNWPAETFIHRHVMALQTASFLVQLVARHRSDAVHESASLDLENEKICAEIMPNFNHFSFLEKLVGLRFLTSKSVLNRNIISLGEKILLGYFERLAPDLIHFHDATLAASMCWIPLALGVPFTLSVRGSDIQVFPLKSPHEKEKIVHALERAAGVHTVCNNLGEQASELVGREINFSTIYTTVPLPTNLPGWPDPDNGEKIRFVSSGRLMWRKGFGYLLVALKHLRDLGLDARLTIIGVGPDLDHLLYLRKVLGLDEYVNFPGKLDYERIKMIFQNSHAYIQSSVAEGLSNSLVEAMANGLPVFATDVGGTREAIEDGTSGFLLPPLSPQEWTKKLLMVRDSALMTQVRACAYDNARLLFSANLHAHEFMAFYQSILMQ